MALSDRPAVKACKTCGEEIKAQARKCIHCDAYQDWRGAISLSTAVLSLLVAVVSVLIAAGPAIKRALTPHRSVIEVSFQVGDEDSLSAFVHNTGSQPATLNGASLRSRRGDQVVEFGLQSVDQTPIGQAISPGARQLVVYQFTGRYDTRKAGKDKPGCSLAVTVTNYDSRQQTVVGDVGCERVKAFADAHDPMR